VGAGLGGTTRTLSREGKGRWVCLEPDAQLADQLREACRAGTLPACCEVVVGSLAEAAVPGPFATILYIDVLEHIADDRVELARAAAHLQPGGHVVVLSPAHPWLFTPFDQAIGHYRRYTKPTLKALTPESLHLVRLIYLDSVGLLASSGNRLFLKQSMPSPGQIALWDRVMVPLSRFVDPVVGYRLGKSILGVWQKPQGG
jgi:hypothetical protein